MSKPVHVYQVYITAPPAAVWEAIVDGDATVRYFYGTRVQSTWEPGAAVTYRYPDGRSASEGQVIAIEPGRRLEMTFLPLWDPELAAEGPAREVWSPEGGRVHTDFANGLSFIISGLCLLYTSPSPRDL